MYMCVCADVIWIASVHLRVQSKLRFIASHRRLHVRMHLDPTADTDRQPLNCQRSHGRGNRTKEIERVWLTCSTSYMAASIGR